MQNNPAFELSALNAVQRAQAKQRAEETRKKLFESASRLEGEAEDCIVTFTERQESGSSHQDRGRQDRKQKRDGTADPGPKEDWTESQVSGGLDLTA